MENKLDLKNVTLFCFDGREEIQERTSLYRSIFGYMMDRVDFYDVKFFSTFDFKFAGVNVINTRPVNIGYYSEFCIKRLKHYVESEYCLIFQDDGFILNPHLWENEFFEYDYIGAPWPLYIGWPREGYQVGNGGFSLRSKKFLDVSSQLESTTANEDTYILNQNRDHLNSCGIKIAPVEVARKFAIEFELDKEHTLSSCFGFHSKRLLNEAIAYINKK